MGGGTGEGVVMRGQREGTGDGGGGGGGGGME